MAWTRLSAIGIHWDPEAACFCDGLGTWTPWSISSQELQHRLEAQWQAAVAASLQHRPGFGGLQRVDAFTTRLLLRQFGQEAQAVLRVALTGRFFTERELHHVGQSDQPFCPFCGAIDGIPHRVESCPMFQADRAQHLGHLQDTVSSLAPIQKEHAWALQPAGISDLQCSLLSIGWGEADSLQPLCSVGRPQHLFVDGSCLMPRVPPLRLAAWSVVLALSDTLFESSVIDVGPLPTVIQTSFRAEIYAMLKALQYIVISPGDFCVWSDCAGVVAKLQRFQDGGPEPLYLSSNSDLWRMVWEALQGVRHRVTICKVPAHMDVLAAEDLVHEWAIVLNGVADSAAKHANLNRPESFWSLWNQVRVSYNQELDNAQRCMDFHAAMGLRATTHKGRTHDAVAPAQQPGPTHWICFADVVSVPMPKLVARWGADYVDRLSSWLRTNFLAPTDEAVPAWISKVELFFGFLLATGYLPPVYEAKRKVWLRSPHLIAQTHRRVQWFNQNLSAVAHALGQPLVFENRWPSSAALGGLHPCLAIVLPVQLKSSIDRYLTGHMTQLRGLPATRWRSLPLPEACLR